MTPSCALWTTDEDAARAKDDFKGMVERLVSQVSFWIMCGDCRDGCRKITRGTGGRQALKEGRIRGDEEGPRVGLLREGSSVRCRPTDAGGVWAIGGVQRFVYKNRWNSN